MVLTRLLESRDRMRSVLSAQRRGVTLLELLIVVLIIVSVSVLVARMLNPSLDSRRIREAARMVEVFMNRARTRAIQNGRSAGVWIERMPGLSEAAISLTLCEVPEAYTGDFINSGAEMYVYPRREVFPKPGPKDQVMLLESSLISGQLDGNGFRRYLRNLDVWLTPDPSFQQVIRSGDTIEFGNSSTRWYMYSVDEVPSRDESNFATDDGLRIIGPDGQAYPRWVVAEAHAARTPRLGVNLFALSPSDDFDDDSQYEFSYDSEGWYVMEWRNRTRPGHPVATTGSTHVNYVSTPGAAVGTPINYLIRRSPVRSPTDSVTLPDLAVIDLNFSGTRERNFHGRTAEAYSDSTVNTLQYPGGTPPNPYRFQPQWQDDDSAIVLTFSPGGEVDTLYSRSWDPTRRRLLGNAARAGSWEWGPEKNLRMPIHFLIGKRDKLPADLGFSETTAFDLDQALAAHLACNWTDPECLWVSIQPQTGFISTSANVPVTPRILQQHLASLNVTITGDQAKLFYASGLGGLNDLDSIPADVNLAFNINDAQRAARWNPLDHAFYGARRLAIARLAKGGH